MTIESLQYKTVEKEQFEGKERDFFTIFQTRTVLLWLIQRDGENNLGKNLISKILFIMSVKLLCLQLLQSGAQQISCPCSLQKKITGKSPNYIMVSVSAFRLAQTFLTMKARKVLQHLGFGRSVCSVDTEKYIGVECQTLKQPQPASLFGICHTNVDCYAYTFIVWEVSRVC